jgi:peptide/nickel transport system substrate-binding protein
LLAESGYAGEPVTLMAAQDLAHHKAWGDVTIDLLKQLDMKVDLFITSYYGADFADPTKRFLRANGNELSNGWSNNPQIEAETAAWYNATNLDEEKTIVRRLNRLAVDYVV